MSSTPDTHVQLLEVDIPSRSRSGNPRQVTRGHCPCPGFAHRGTCWHYRHAEQLAAVLPGQRRIAVQSRSQPEIYRIVNLPHCTCSGFPKNKTCWHIEQADHRDKVMRDLNKVIDGMAVG